MTKYYFVPGDAAFPQETLYVVTADSSVFATYSDCAKCGCKYWHNPFGLTTDNLKSISKCKARKLLKAWNPSMEMPL